MKHPSYGCKNILRTCRVTDCRTVPFVVKYSAMSYQLLRSVSEKKNAKEFSFSNKYVIALGIALGYRLTKALFCNPPTNEYVLTAPVERSRDGKHRGKERGVEHKTRGCPPAFPIPTCVEGDVPATPHASFLVDELYSEVGSPCTVSSRSSS